MTLTLDKPKDQKLLHSEISWQQFKLIQQGFSDQEFLDGTRHVIDPWNQSKASQI